MEVALGIHVDEAILDLEEGGKANGSSSIMKTVTAELFLHGGDAVPGLVVVQNISCGSSLDFVDLVTEPPE